MEKHSNANVAEAYANSPCGYLSTNVGGTVLQVNQTLLDWIGYRREDFLTKSLQEFLTVPGRIFYETQYFPLLQMQGFVKEVSLDIVCKDRKVLPVLINSTIQSTSKAGDILIHSAVFDATHRTRYEADLLRRRCELQEEIEKRTSELEVEIADRKHAEAELRELTGRLLQLRDEERRRLARELHDSIGQMLAALNMNLALIAEDAGSLGPRAAAALAENARWVNEISSEIRTISHLLHPPLLDEVGLTSALTWYVDGLAERADMKINLEISADLGRLPKDQELAVFRIVQECLTNVHRHSGSKTAAVRIMTSADTIRVEVEDHGRGIGSVKLIKLESFGSGVGLRGMRERARQLGGSVNITSHGHGTVVTTSLPRMKTAP